MVQAQQHARTMTEPTTRLARVCALLNAEQVRYAIVGGHALQLHGYVRATRDVDVLIEATLENATRALRALGNLPFKIARDLLPGIVVNKPITVIGDDPNVELLTLAWSVRYADALAGLQHAELEGITVPYVDIDTLIRSKQTGRLSDQADVERLERLKQLQQSP
jgi:hypothetical protein